jgi:hypothetical protein
VNQELLNRLENGLRAAVARDQPGDRQTSQARMNLRGARQLGPHLGHGRTLPPIGQEFGQNDDVLRAKARLGDRAIECEAVENVRV